MNRKKTLLKLFNQRITFPQNEQKKFNNEKMYFNFNYLLN